MTKWPAFVTKDLGDTEQDADEMLRRWQDYDRRMREIIAAGGVHQDDDGGWVDGATGELIGPDPDIERPLSSEEMRSARPMREVLPELYEKLRQASGLSS